VQISTINWDDFRLFLELVRRGSARGAAQALDVSHSTIVRRVERLEKSLGATLFDRDFTGYRPTAAGETLLQSAESAEQAILTADRQLRGKDAQLNGEIRLTTSDVLASYFLAPELRTFTDAYAQISLSVLVSYDLYDLARREADIAIRFIGGGRKPPDDLIGRKLGGISSCYYASETYLDEFDLRSENNTATWIGWGEEDLHPAWVKASPYPNAPIRGHFNNAMLQASAVENGLGLATLPCFVGDAIPGVIRIPGCEPHANYDVWMLSHPDLRDAARHRIFRSFIVDLFAEKHRALLGT
jgi:DNA-binding transcriptional LysR family regulator